MPQVVNFDDLIPAQQGGMFDDLIPQQVAPRPFVEDERLRNVENVMNRVSSGQQNRLSGAMEIYGQGLGQQLDDIGSFIGRHTADEVKQGLGYVANQASDLGGYLGESLPASGQDFVANTANDVSRNVNYVKENYPNEWGVASGLGNVANIIGAATPFGFGSAKTIQGASSVGKALEASGTAVKLGKRDQFIQDLVLPRETPKVLADQNRREVGWNRKQIVEPGSFEKSVADSVSQVKGVKPSNSLLGNENALEGAYASEAMALRFQLGKSGVKYKPLAKQSILNDAKTAMADDPLLEEAVANKVLQKAQSLIDKHGDTPAGLLTARQELDKWAKMKRVGVFEKDNVLGANVRTVRQSINDYIAKSVPDAKVKESLTKQFHYRTAADNIADKRARAPKTRLGRAANSIKDKVSLKDAVIGTGLAVGVPVGALTGTLPFAAGAGGLYLSSKALMSPTAREVLGRGLQLPAKAARKVGAK